VLRVLRMREVTRRRRRLLVVIVVVVVVVVVVRRRRRRRRERVSVLGWGGVVESGIDRVQTGPLVGGRVVGIGHPYICQTRSAQAMRLCMTEGDGEQRRGEGTDGYESGVARSQEPGARSQEGPRWPRWKEARS
jgi:hypothetical protein